MVDRAQPQAAPPDWMTLPLPLNWKERWRKLFSLGFLAESCSGTGTVDTRLKQSEDEGGEPFTHSHYRGCLSSEPGRRNSKVKEMIVDLSSFLLLSMCQDPPFFTRPFSSWGVLDQDQSSPWRWVISVAHSIQEGKGKRKQLHDLFFECRDLPASLREEDVLITISRCRWDAWKQRLLSNYQFEASRRVNSRSGSKPVWEVSPRSQSESSEASASAFPSQRGLLLLPAMTTTDSSPVLSVVETVEEQLAESSLGPTKWDWRTKGRRDILWPKALSRAGFEPALLGSLIRPRSEEEKGQSEAENKKIHRRSLHHLIGTRLFESSPILRLWR